MSQPVQNPQRQITIGAANLRSETAHTAERHDAALAARLRADRRQVVRIVIAGCVSWQICVLLGSGAPPVFAVIVPLVAMDEQPFSALNVSLGRLVGVVGGLVLGILLVRWLGPSVATIGLVLSVGLVAGMVLRVGGALNIQVAVSALLVFASAHPDTYATNRLWETAVGAGVTVLLAPLIMPVNPLTTFCQEFSEAVADLAVLLAEAAALVAAPRFESNRAQDLRRACRAIEERASRLPGELEQAQRAVRFNPLHRRARTRLARLGPHATLIVQVAHQERVLMDELADLAAREDVRASWPTRAEPLGFVLKALADAIGRKLDSSDASQGNGPPAASSVVKETLDIWHATGSGPVDVLLRRRVRLLAHAVSEFAAASRDDIFDT